MKKIILTSAIIFAAVAGVFAQTPGLTSTANLKVVLNPVQAIVVNPLAKSETLTYKTVADYEGGVASTAPLADHLKVYAAGGFTVSASAADLTTTGGTIAASSITVTPTAGTTKALAGASLTAKPLSSTGATIISSTKGGTGVTFNMSYKGAGDFDYIDKHLNGQAPTEYTTVVTYTIAAQ